MLIEKFKNILNKQRTQVNDSYDDDDSDEDYDDADNTQSSSMDQVKSARSPLDQLLNRFFNWDALSGQPLAIQLRLFTLLLLISLASGVIVVAYDVQYASNRSALVEISVESLMHSQRLAKAVPTAVQGNPDAFQQLRDSRDRLASNLSVMKLGGTYGGRRVDESSQPIQLFLVKLIEEWQRTEKNASLVLDQERVLTSLASSLQKLNEANPTLLELTEQIAALKLQNGAPAREIAATAQLVMLTQRMGKNSNELFSGQTVSPETAYLLGKDANTFKDLVEASISGSDLYGLRPATERDMKDKLMLLQKQFQSTYQSISDILSNLPKIIAAKQAQQLVFKENEQLRQQFKDLQDAYNTELRSRTYHFIFMGVSALMSIIAAALIARVYLDDSIARATEAERLRETAEAQEQEAKFKNEQTQLAILRLMNELQEVADGDLTVQATVSEDITGAIADSINYTVEELRTLASRINSAAEQLNTGTTQAQQTSSKLLAAAEQQSREIRASGESVLRMAQQIKIISNNAADSAKVARQSLDTAENGTVAIKYAMSGMNEIREQIQDTSKRIKRLGESSQQVGEIVELISDITEQTNVLALNAAIQAASAGEAGRGFSVVAEEVQRLAERSGEATKQIATLIRMIQTDTQDAVSAMEHSTQGVVEGAKLSDSAGKALEDISKVSKKLAELIENISQSTFEQASSAGDVAQSIQRILLVTEQTTRGTQQTASAIKQLTELAEQLKSYVARFRVSN